MLFMLIVLLSGWIYAIFNAKSIEYDAAIDEEIARLRKEDLENPPHPDECF